MQDFAEILHGRVSGVCLDVKSGLRLEQTQASSLHIFSNVKTGSEM